MQRTIVIGDIHGEIDHLTRLLHHLPTLDAEDTVVFLGDYIDRGSASRQVIERIVEFRAACPGHCVTLCGNHEDAWLHSLESPNPGFLLPAGNGCLQTLQSFVDCKHLAEPDQLAMLLQPHTWFPESVQNWMRELPAWYEDAHAIYVHAGLQGEGEVWLPPNQSQRGSLLWMRERDFWMNYRGKRLVFGHTHTTELPIDHLNWFQRIFNDQSEVWFRGSLIGIDTGCGKPGGFLSAVELPSGKVYESRR